MGKYALITGASKGIGRAIAIQLAQAGYNLFLVARSETELQELANYVIAAHGVKAAYLVKDLSQDNAGVLVAEWVRRSDIQLSVLINNAGYGLWGNFAELSLDGQMNMLRLNLDATIEITYHLLPLLKKQPKAYVLNVSSTAAYQALPTLALYSASKAFILSFSRALRYELKDTTVSVSVLSPGPTDTGFAHRAGLDALADLAEKFNMRPQDVARIGLKGLFDGKAEIVPGFLNKLSAYAAKHLFKTWIERISAGLYRHSK
ncbi:SDR family NAD(P)-dependent oxidoreductase [Mucilaginibacter paludis]|uniref:Short-chain dehydrogenase/reductase SDR n=1 Tax=Mucilaginibacter paludis DSM 18603 TaxID=714943 RepID=H1Y735_9SPHI|nr:SDR family oxidoreductase [Mucilaginibacter paludis]EHQ28654.1 short-chain dehydrogenase/reductase SDR [Mucilaginibacter paludis DSM 18603]